MCVCVCVKERVVCGRECVVCAREECHRCRWFCTHGRDDVRAKQLDAHRDRLQRSLKATGVVVVAVDDGGGGGEEDVDGGGGEDGGGEEDDEKDDNDDGVKDTAATQWQEFVSDCTVDSRQSHDHS